MLPVKVSAPSMIFSPATPTWNVLNPGAVETPDAKSMWRITSQIPTSPLAAPPSPLTIAIRSGIAVIGMNTAIIRPITPPATMPTTIQPHWTISSCCIVPTIASSMPQAASMLPRRAVSAELRSRIPTMNSTAAARYSHSVDIGTRSASRGTV